MKILDFVNNSGRIKQHIIGNIWNDCEVTQMEFSVIIADDKDYMFDYRSFDELSTKEKKEKYKKVYEGFLKDVDAGKVFQQDFAGYDYQYEEREKITLANSFDFTVFNKDVIYFSDEATFWDSGDYYGTTEMHQQDIYVNLTTDCTNTIKALKDEGFYDKEEDLITNYEFSKKYDEYYSDDYIFAEPYGG